MVALPPVEPHDGQPYGSNSGDASTVISLAAEDSLVTQVQFAAPLADQEEPRTLQLVPADAETADSVSPAEVPAEEELTFQPSSDPPAEEVQAEEVQAEEVQAEEVQAIPDAVPIDLGIALQLTSGQNPQVAFAQAQINEAYAQLQAAQVLWLPSIRFGASYNKHEGRIQDVAGNVFETSRIGGYAGLGIRGIGSGSPSFPGIAMHFKLSDAIYDPRIASRRTRARQSAASAVVNDELLESALAYINLLEALQVQAVAAQTVEHSEDLARVTADFARAGQGTQGDADRAAASRAVQRNRLIRAQSDIVIASARLSQQLSLDPGLLVMPQEPVLAPIDLSNADLPLPELVATGLTNRPELSASRLLVAEAAQRLRREVHSPWLPSLYLGMDYGGMGGGLGNEISNSSDRWDMDAVAYWEIRNLGFGEQAARAEATAQVSQARFRQVETMDLVAREVVEAQVEVVAQRQQIDIAEQAVAAAQASFRRNLQRIEQAQGLPIEVLQSILALDEARREYLRAIADYNAAQFRLHRALGWPVRDPVQGAA